MSKQTMTDMEAIDIAEGYTETDDIDLYAKAWQHLIDTGLAWSLQGWFGRQAMRLVRGGYCTLPENERDGDEEAR
tara:strand:- start:2334 stop:2558 length:225 start_codon:yes stop_codon:yes gene_type:complete